MTQSTNPRSGESGAALLLVIVFITVFGLVTAALLDLASTGFKTSTAIADVRDDHHRVEGAMEAAINRVRNSSSIGYEDVDCPSPLQQDGVVVTCTGEGASTGGVDDAFPKYALMALGSGAEGIVVVDGNDDFTIDGGAHSNGVVVAGSSSGSPNQLMRVFGDLHAVGDCGPSSKLLVTGLQRCTGAPSEPDPGYPPAVTSIASLPADPPPTCGGGVVRFAPGLYSVSPATLAAGCSGQWWFPPGVYYLDFNAEWTVSGTVRVGTSGSGVNTCDPSGAQLIFGGSTRLRTSSNSTLVLCAGARGATAQHIAMYALSSGSRGPSVTGSARAADAISDPGPPSPQWSDPGRAIALDNVNTSVSLLQREQATISLQSFAGSPAIQDGATITSVTLRYRHCPSSNATAEFTLDTGDGTTSRTVGAPKTGSCSTLRTADVTTTLNQLDGQITWRRLKDLRIRYTATRDNPGGPAPQSSTLDGVELQVQFTQPGFEAHACPSNCPLLDATGSNSAVLAQGTLYAPTARLALLAHNKGGLGFARGVIARTVNITISSSSKQPNAPFSLPGEDSGRVAVLEATIDGVPHLRAQVEFDDSDSLPGRSARVLKWSVLR